MPGTIAHRAVVPCRNGKRDLPVQNVKTSLIRQATLGAMFVLLTGCALKLTTPGGSQSPASSSPNEQPKTVEYRDDGFRDQLSAGCESAAECESVRDKANARHDECKATIKKLKWGSQERESVDWQCDNFTDPDRRTASKMFEEAESRDRRADRAAAYEHQKAERERVNAERLAEQRAESEARNHARQAKRDAKAAAKAALLESAEQPEFAIPVLSTRICKSQDTLALLKDDMRTEKRQTRESGVMDMGNRRALVEAMDVERADIKRYKKELRSKFNASPRSCKSKVHKRILECQAVYHPSTYSREERNAVRAGTATHDELFAQHVQEQRCEEPFGTYVDILSARIYR